MRFGTDSVIGEKLDHVRGISRKTREIGDARGRQDNSDLAPSPSKSGIAVGISADLRVPVGGSGAVIATVTGTKDNAVEWSVTGKGCSGSVCGKMT